MAGTSRLLSGVSHTSIPDRFFGVEAASTASLHLSALYGALAVAFAAAGYAGESSYFLHERERDSLSLATLAERYGGACHQQGAGAPPAR